MNKSLLSLFVSILFVLGFTVGIAYAGGGGINSGGPADYESDMVDVSGTDFVTGGECKIKGNDTVKMEIEREFFSSATRFKCCIEHDETAQIECDTFDHPGGVSVDIICQCDISQAQPPSNSVLTGVICNIYSGSGTSCDGSLEYTSGIDAD